MPFANYRSGSRQSLSNLAVTAQRSKSLTKILLVLIRSESGVNEYARQDRCYVLVFHLSAEFLCNSNYPRSGSHSNESECELVIAFVKKYCQTFCLWAIRHLLFLFSKSSKNEPRLPYHLYCNVTSRTYVFHESKNILCYLSGLTDGGVSPHGRNKLNANGEISMEALVPFCLEIPQILHLWISLKTV